MAKNDAVMSGPNASPRSLGVIPLRSPGSVKDPTFTNRKVDYTTEIVLTIPKQFIEGHNVFCAVDNTVNFLNGFHDAP